MVRPPTALRLLLLGALGARAAVSASAPPTPLHRRDLCAANALQRCSNGLPDTFCCPEGSSCLSLAGATTVLCCPSGRDCTRIQPIICDVAKQDAEKSPTAPIKTTALDAPLPRCGASLCCPFGYSCSDDGNECLQNADQSKPPRALSSAVPTTATTRPAPHATPASTDAPPPTASTPAGDQQPDASSGPNKALVVGGIVGGCVGLLLVMAVVVLCVRRRRNAVDRNSSDSSALCGTVISAPVLHPNTYRSDFLRVVPPLRAFPPEPQPPPPPAARHASIPNPFDSPDPHSQSPTHSRASITSSDERNARTGHVAGRLAPIRVMRPSEMRHSRRPDHVCREPSGEGISVFADPVAVGRDLRGATFSEEMERAGFGPSPAPAPANRLYVPGTTPRI